jgi:hypothetical protein
LSNTFPVYIYELIHAVEKYEEEHPTVRDNEGQWCFTQWLNQIPAEHRKLAEMLDEIKRSIESTGEFG